MPIITDWLMVVITAVYVIATIAICWANIKAANATKAQLEEMKRQYAEENRPIIETEFHYERRTWYIIRFVNHGRQTAQHVKIELDPEFIESLPEEVYKSTLLEQKGKECIIGVGQHYDLYIGSNAMRGNPNMRPVTGDIYYDGYQNSYSDKVFIDLKNYMTFFSSTTDNDDLLKAVKKNAEELKGIRNELQSLRAQGDKHE